MARRPPKDSPAAELGRTINALRERAGLSYEDLADRLSISTDGVKKLMNGSSTAQYAKVPALARALGVTPNELFGVSVVGYNPKVLQKILEMAFRQLGASSFQASLLAKTVEQVLQSPPIEMVDPETAAIVQFEVALRQLAQSKPS